MSGTVHIVGAGLAGLSTAVRLTAAGREVALWEAAAHAGGRCRTFWDPRLECHVDNGNHLLLSGNRSAGAYLRLIGGDDKMRTAEAASFPFYDAGSGERWAVHLNAGRVPWWVARPTRRIPGTRLGDYLSGLRLALAAAGRTVAEVISTRGPLWQRFWEPLTLAVLNTTPQRGSAPLLWRAMAETFARGGAHCRPMLAPEGLGTALVTPALAFLERHGMQPQYGHALKAVDRDADRVTGLRFANGRTVTVAMGDSVVLALPPTRLKAVLPEIEVPDDDAGIVNAHFRVSDPAILADCAPITGLVNATSHWVFVRGDVASVTISAADRLGVMDEAPNALIERLWMETSATLGIAPQPYLAARINKERRATFDQSPAGVARRPAARTALANLVLAGDATRTGLPATIEGAIRSGEIAARLAA